MEVLFQANELLHLALHQPAHGDAGPGRDDLGHILLGHLLVQHLPVALELLQGGVVLLELLLELDQRPEAELRRSLEVALTLGALEGRTGFLDLLLARPDPVDQLLLSLPMGAHAGDPLLEVRELLLEPLEPFARCRVALLREGGLLDLELPDASFDLIDLDRHRVDLDAQAAGGLVDQIDGLVGEETSGHVAVREHGGRDERRVLDPDTMVDLVPLLQAAEDRDRVLHARLFDEDRLETSLERRVLLDVLSVFVQRGRTDRPELTARQHRLEHVAGVHRALRGARAHDGVQLVDERDDLPVGPGDLLQDRLEALLELASILRAREHRAQVQRDDLLVLERLGDVPGHDALGQALHDGGLADSRLTDQDRVVLRPPGQHLDHATDLLVATDHGVELAGTSLFGEIAPVLLQSLEGLLRVLAGDPATTADLGEGGERFVAGHAGTGQQLRRPSAVVAEHREQQMLGGDVLVRELFRLGGGRSEHARREGRETDLRSLREDLGQTLQRRVHLVTELLRLHAQVLQEREDDALGIRQEREQHVLRDDLLVVAGERLRVRTLHGRPGLHGQLVGVHRSTSSFVIGTGPGVEGVVARGLPFHQPEPPHDPFQPES